jgi:hypothetical protein
MEFEMMQETDRGLLELAAKAAGIEIHGFFGDDETGEWWADVGEEEVIEWNPLTDDGDALRLAVKLNLIQKHSFTDALAEENDACNGDYYFATRRAIVRAAAEIGKAMA